MDPATAACNMVAAICNLLATPEGQKVMAEWRELIKALLDAANAEIKAAPAKRALLQQDHLE